MPYQSTEPYDRKIDMLMSNPASGSYASSMANALRMIMAERQGKKRDAVVEQNQQNQQRELAMILRGQQTGRVGDTYASLPADQFVPSDPALRELTAKMLMERSTMGSDLQNKMALEQYKSSLPNSGEYALSPMTFKNPDGTYSFGQLNKAGGLKLIETPQGLQYVPDSGRLGFNPANIYERGGADNAVAAARQGAVGDIQTQQAIEQAAGVEQARIAAIPQRGAAETQVELERTAAQTQQTRSRDAMGTLELLDMAEPLLEVSTGSGAGAARDKLGAVFGWSGDGAQAAAQLQTLAGQLIMKMPRMEGPQSNMDQQLYRQMAGQIGDPTVPNDVRMAALRTIRQLNEKYASLVPATSPTLNLPPGSTPITPQVQSQIDALLQKYGAAP